ncbi:tautomerase family protein [Enterobacteriaceae bacterium RIT814]|nr:tautomerase family protein [Enterobacteriaceae bacterium RIT 814]
MGRTYAAPFPALRRRAAGRGRSVARHIVAGKPRSEAQKTAFYRRLASELSQQMGIAEADVMVVIQFTAAEDWSSSGGVLYQP